MNTVDDHNKIGIDKKTIYAYLEKMEKAFFISRVKRLTLTGKKC
jgi:predicted AAA+ superfamily ATPase